MKRYILNSLLCAGLFSSCSNDVDVPRLHEDLGFPTHEVVFHEVGDSITLSASISWVATLVYNKTSDTRYTPNPVTADAFRGTQWCQEIEADGLKLVKRNSCDVTLINEGIQEGETLILSCTSDFVSHNIEEIKITADYLNEP